MNKPTRLEYEPDYAVPPGDTLAETIFELELSQAEVARRTGLSLKHINQIIKGIAPISHEVAVSLERVTAVPARLWDELEANYRRRALGLREAEELRQAESWLTAIPVRELVKRGLVEDASNRGVLIQRLLAFFGVASLEAWHEVWTLKPSVTLYRRPDRGIDEGALVAWLRQGELEARKMATQRPFDAQDFREHLEQIRAASRNPRTAVAEAVRICGSAGVVLVVVEEFAGSPVSGAARWISPTKPLIQLSLRYRRDDHFWFSFFHEAGHILMHPKRPTYIDDITEDSSAPTDHREQKANSFASDVLIPPHWQERFVELKTITQVIRFARDIGVAPGIVVGQLQRKGLRPYRWGNELRAEVIV
jgi:HTH-type transcriptional regulator/antitoxin HigA